MPGPGLDECHLFLAPVAVGAGKPALRIHGHLRLGLLDQRYRAGGADLISLSLRLNEAR